MTTATFPEPSDSNPFEAWYNTKGLRMFSKHHGSAKGHEEYMNEAFSAGYKYALDVINKSNVKDKES